MKKFITTSIFALTTITCFASDYIPQEVTSEVYVQETKQTQKTYTNSTYCQYKNDPVYCNKQVKPVSNVKLEPVTVHTGRTVTIKDHYDVYQPRIVYDKVNSYTTTKTCKYCD